jgi:hypothetical protein
MRLRPLLIGTVIAVLAVALGYALFTTLARRLAQPVPDAVAEDARPAEPVAPPSSGPKIKATLFFGADDGFGLVGVEHEVPLAEPAVAQARAIVEAQLTAEPPPPLVPALPRDVKLRAVYMADSGDVFIDLDGQALRAGAQGSLEELMAVYALVNAVTVNLPTVGRVQLLLDGREADTLAGHVDLRQPLRKNEGLIRTP